MGWGGGRFGWGLEMGPTHRGKAAMNGARGWAGRGEKSPAKCYNQELTQWLFGSFKLLQIKGLHDSLGSVSSALLLLTTTAIFNGDTFGIQRASSRPFASPDSRSTGN